jgi:hydrogenase expression/formation protein HypC
LHLTIHVQPLWMWLACGAGLISVSVPGDWVLIHVGFAMSKISEADALDQMRTLEMLGESEAAVQEVRGYGLEDVQDKHSP